MLNDEIKRILDDKNPEEKLEEVKKAIEIVTGIQNGEYVYCKKCNDYFLAGSDIIITNPSTNELMVFGTDNDVSIVKKFVERFDTGIEVQNKSDIIYNK